MISASCCGYFLLEHHNYEIHAWGTAESLVHPFSCFAVFCYMDLSQIFIYFFKCWTLSCFQNVILTYNTAIFLHPYTKDHLGYIPRNGIAESWAIAELCAIWLYWILTTCPTEWFHHLRLPPAVYEKRLHILSSIQTYIQQIFLVICQSVWSKYWDTTVKIPALLELPFLGRSHKNK